MGAQTPDQLHPLFLAAFNRGDLDAILALYEPQASLVPQPGLVTQGQDANGQALQQFLALKGQMSMTTSFAIPNGDLALLRSQWSLIGTGPDGKRIELGGRSIEIARRQPNGEWLFVIDHPFGAS
jgi:ketosteroid isomerase-like protein